MSLSINLLSYEHGILRQVIDVLKEVGEKQTVDKHRHYVMEIVQFLDVYLDQFHHAKEEQFLFPPVIGASALLSVEIPKLIRDHQHAKDLLNVMKIEIKRKPAEAFCKASLELVEHMTSHIDKEELLIFPKIEGYLTPEVNKRINREYSDFNRHFGPDFYRTSEHFAKKIQNDILGPGAFRTTG
ncbi:MAG: hemerythrin domain-containing protein [Candidatus Methanomethylicaceae archaeon]|jgi:hemerythrin-like domain-containing protein